MSNPIFIYTAISALMGKKTRCPYCGHGFAVRNLSKDKAVVCPSCGRKFKFSAKKEKGD